MHFDIIVPDYVVDESIVYKMGREYLSSKGQQEQPLTSKECSFCHQERASPEMELSIRDKGYYIIEMEGCD